MAFSAKTFDWKKSLKLAANIFGLECCTWLHMDYKSLHLLAVHAFFKPSEIPWRSATHHMNTYRKRRIPVLAKAKARPKIPLPIIALLRLKTDIPSEVVPGIWRSKDRRVSNSLEQSREMHLCFKPCVLWCIRVSNYCYGNDWIKIGLKEEKAPLNSVTATLLAAQ